MQRAGIFIGVSKTGHLQALNDAASSARRMHAWGVSQGMKDGSAAQLITDETTPVTPDRIFDAVETIIEKVAPEQLVIYFAGHGVVIRRSEQWLLSKAPERATHAVDMSRTCEDARFGPIRHVVVISDACRTAPEGIQAQNVEGGSIFPNMPEADTRFVDAFFACKLGRPAAELLTQDESVASYRAVYTEVLLEALQGKFRQALYRREGDPAWYADPRQLRDVLAVEVPRRIKSKKLTVRYQQEPDSNLPSDPGMYLTRLEALPWQPRYRGSESSTPSSPETRLDLAQQHLVNLALAGDRAGLSAALSALLTDPVPGGEDFANSVAMMLRKFGPLAFETQCGFKVEGALIREWFPRYPEAELLAGGASLRLRPPRGAASQLLAFDNGLVAILPAIQDFIAALVFEDDELISVTYEPSKNSWRARAYAAKEERLRDLRAVAASSSLHGRFVVEDADAASVASSMQVSEGVDPTLAVYAAYAFHDLRLTGRIAQMSGDLQKDVGATFFDLELLSRRLVDRAVQPQDSILPCVPLLTQGWSIMRSHRTALPAAVRDIERHARDSLWSVYDRPAFGIFQQALSQGQVR